MALNLNSRHRWQATGEKKAGFALSRAMGNLILQDRRALVFLPSMSSPTEVSHFCFFKRLLPAPPVDRGVRFARDERKSPALYILGCRGLYRSATALVNPPGEHNSSGPGGGSFNEQEHHSYNNEQQEG